MAQFVDDLNMELISECGPRPLFRLHEPLRYITSISDQGDRPIGLICVPKGFQTDLASVPRLPVAWLIAGGVGNRAAVVHDWLCVKRHYTSIVAARIFAEALAASGIDAWRRALMYAAVRCCGPRW
jgi:Protein of unknown function (DUF1353)